MAGHHMRTDPAIERWAEWRNQQHRSFRWTPRTVFWTVISGLVIPGGLMYLSVQTRGNYISFSGKLRGEPLVRDDLLRMQKKE